MKFLPFVIVLLTVFSCTKEPHRYIGDDDGNTWIIDEMMVTITDGSTAIADTTVTSGEFRFNKLKNKDDGGNGSVTRFEYSGSWSTTTVEEGFIWSMDGENNMEISYEDGRHEFVTIDKSERKSQEWTSTSLETGDDVVRKYTLSLD